MMNQPARAGDRFVVIANLQFLHPYFAPFQRRVRFRSFRLAQPIDPEHPRAPPQLGYIPRFRQFYVAIERRLRFGF